MVKKFPKLIHVVTLDNISFHFEEGVVKWKFVFHQSITPERDLYDDAKKCKKAMEFPMMLRY